MTGYVLANGLSFCRAEGRFIFLDLAADRYFALPSAAEPAFERLVSDRPLSAADEASLQELEQQAILARAPSGSRPALCIPPHRPVRSLIANGRRVSPFTAAEALARFVGARLELRFRPLGRVLDRLGRRMPTARSSTCPEAAEAVAAAFRQSALLVSPLDQCLPRSIAAAHALLARGCRPELVIGVSGRPFAAHCWVQCGDVLVTEEMDEVANFTPILVL